MMVKPAVLLKEPASPRAGSRRPVHTCCGTLPERGEPWIVLVNATFQVKHDSEALGPFLLLFFFSIHPRLSIQQQRPPLQCLAIPV